ncbi:hypothetical protein [Acinetobacter sp. ANC 3832]|uniref:hypothetical protein n=1 Tax=Acinetobacter sp. ANC 3832 TaxID=1977874 RepID=UPI000B672211|nr:hypothetical protein [Acinetobacter sp. ANC 3832]OTG85810.1 hypothetical protein B9T35_18145 [Acinetobacter sp. ANC 3832]
MTFSNFNALDLLGKQVSFNSSLGDIIFPNQGIVISLILNLSGSPEILIENGGSFYCLSEITDLKVF